MAEDAAQEGLLIAFKKLPALKDPTLFGAWLSSIIRNRCRRLSTDPSARNVSLDGFLLEQAPSIGNPPEMTLLFEEILRYVAGLPRDLSEIAHLYYFDHWNVGQIARFLSIPQTTVKWRLHECRKQLRRRFNTDEKN
jgi:RNA polymerase sigma-70 factor (ECF subfamily)